jgi:glyoxylase-like metal-dependent hydrolase (beta-lactamase superfamily II)
MLDHAISQMIPSRTLRFLVAMALLAAGPCCAAAGGVELTPVAEGVYLVRGALAEPSPANGGRVSNLGVIVGSEGVITIGTGTSDGEAEAFLSAIARVTDRPVVLGINAYGAPDQVLGNGVFARRGIPVLAHRETDRFLVQNCDACIRNLKKSLGDAALGGTTLSRPSRLVDGSGTVRAGGLEIRVLYFGWTAQPGAIAVFDPGSKVLFAGDLASIGRIPEVQAAKVPEWLAAIGEMQAIDARILVPAHGPVTAPRRLQETAAYLRQLEAGVVNAYESGAGIQEAAQLVELPGFREWALYDPLHRRNVHFTYLRVEARDFAR